MIVYVENLLVPCQQYYRFYEDSGKTTEITTVTLSKSTEYIFQGADTTLSGHPFALTTDSGYDGFQAINVSLTGDTSGISETTNSINLSFDSSFTGAIYWYCTTAGHSQMRGSFTVNA